MREKSVRIGQRAFLFEVAVFLRCLTTCVFISDHRTPDRRPLQALMREIPMLQRADRVSR
jgi:hypothetical protein